MKKLTHIAVCLLLLISIAGCVKQKVQRRACTQPPIYEHFDNGVVFVPNIFTPNGDGINDRLEVQYKGVNKLHLVVKDWMGDVVFENYNMLPYDGVWDGYVTDVYGRLLPGSSNIYTVIVTFETSGGIPKKLIAEVALVNDDLHGADPYAAICLNNYNDCVFPDQWYGDSLYMVDPGEHFYVASCQ